MLFTCFRASIDKLRKDNLSLKEELYLENKFSITPLDNAASHRITAMQDEADALTRKVCIQCYCGACHSRQLMASTPGH
jgi:hypothetical protein